MDILIYYGLRAIAGVIVFTLFEYCKVVVTTLQGDNTPKQKGKILPNPLKFVEPIGFLIYVFTGYGWSNPAETSPFMYKNRKVGNLLTYGSPIVLHYFRKNTCLNFRNYTKCSSRSFFSKFSKSFCFYRCV